MDLCPRDPLEVVEVPAHPQAICRERMTKRTPRRGPGGIISTGTPGGVGFARKPPRWLKPGDEVVVRVEGLGELVNPVVAEG